MTENETIKLQKLRVRGLSPTDIAARLKLNPEAVRSFCRRHPVSAEALSTCKNCGAPLMGTARKEYCSDKCRAAWWNKHKDDLDTAVTAVCKCCGKSFKTYKSKNAKYCSQICFFRRNDNNGHDKS